MHVSVHACMCAFVFVETRDSYQPSCSTAVLLCETGSLLRLDLADCLDWQVSGPQESLVSASPVLGFGASSPCLACYVGVGHPNLVLMLAQSVPGLGGAHLPGFPEERLSS